MSHNYLQRHLFYLRNPSEIISDIQILSSKMLTDSVMDGPAWELNDSRPNLKVHDGIQTGSTRTKTHLTFSRTLQLVLLRSVKDERAARR